MPPIGQVAEKDIKALHDPILDETLRWLNKEGGIQLKPDDSLAQAMNGFVRATLELKNAEDVPDKKRIRPEAMQNIQRKKDACEEAAQSIRDAIPGLKEQHPEHGERIRQALNYYIREVTRQSGVQHGIAA